MTPLRVRTLRSALLIALMAGMMGLLSHAALAAPAQRGATHATWAGKKTVPIKEVSGKYVFTKQKVTVKVGTRVVWTNSTDAPHTITSKKSGLFNKDVAAGKTTSIVFKKTGTFAYFCAIHPYMVAKVVVTK